MCKSWTEIKDDVFGIEPTKPKPAPKPAAPAPAPKKAAPKAAPKKEVSAADGKKNEATRQVKDSATGRAAALRQDTLLTGALGLSNDAKLKKKTLLGQ